MSTEEIIKDEAIPKENLETKSETVVEPKKTKPIVVQKSVTEETKPLIYIGPTVPGIARNNQVFTNGELPKELTVKIEEETAIKALIIDVDQLAKADQQIKKENTALNVFYKKALRHLKKGE